MELSNKTQKIIATTCGVILLGILLVLALRNLDFAPATKTQSAEQSNAAADDKDTPADTTGPTTSTNDFSFTAVAGDSYTLLARSAIQQYATTHSLQLTDAQALLAETTLVNNAGAPLLDIGQQVTIRQSDIATVLGVSTASTTNGDTQKADTAASSTNTNTTPATDFSFTAVAGDSYTTLARTAISNYASNNKLSLTGAQRMAAETSLVTAAGFPELTIGQNVTFSAANLKNAVASAKALPADQLAVWQSYAALAGM